MSSTEPPSRIPPRNQGPDTKAERDALSSKGRVEKVREVDADETRKRRFQKYYKDHHDADEAAAEENRPSPYELIAGQDRPKSTDGMDEIEETAIPGPSNAPAPNVSEKLSSEEPDEATEKALPQSHDFWEDVDFPSDEAPPPRTFKETPGLIKRAGFQEPPQRGKGKEVEKKAEMRGAPEPHLGHVKKEQKREIAPPPGRPVPEKMREFSPFGPPDKPEKKQKEDRKLDNVPLKSPLEKEPAAPRVRGLEKEEERYLDRPVKEKKKEKEEGFVYQEPGMMPIRSEEREGGRGSKQGREHKIVEILAPSLPQLPAAVQPIAVAAATQATPYLSPSTVSLFYQMVGTMYVMTGTQGVTRTEILLNNPSFADSKFFGATIKIEKYATAPDSFNVTLTGSNQAVVAFKENIPSLLAAFENGNFTFRVNRIDVEYTTERPVYRRKERGEERGDAAGGDLGERRK